MTLALPPGGRLVAATHNPGKAVELAALLDGRFEVIAAGALGLAEPEETEQTFAGNALLKARFAAEASGEIALADDSGLCIAALNGDPGIYSARWAGPGKDFALAMAEIERRMIASGSSDGRAYFACALAVAWPNGGPAVVVEGRVDGRLTFPPRGDRGFGYDPIFIREGDRQTFAEIDPAAKHAASHRADAFRKLKAAVFLSGAPPIGVYVHWPYCARICPYCDFTVVRDRGRAAEQTALGEAILRDLAAQRALSGPRELVSVFFGGGTPSRMPPALVERIIAAVRDLWSPAEDLEISLEANPGDAARFAGLRAAGIERLSLGMQSLRDPALAFLGRDHDAAQGRAAAERATALFPRVSLDLIYALPGRSLADWRAELAEAVSLGAGHISAYQLTIEAGTAFGRAARRGQLPAVGEDLAADLYEATGEVLSSAGFEAYEVSNHARGEAQRSRHNLVYWRGHDYAAAGPGAHGRLTLDGVRHAFAAPERIADYIAASGTPDIAAYDAAETARERLVMGLRTVEGVSRADLLSLSISDELFVELSDLGLLSLEADRLTATPSGRLVLDSLTARLALA